MRARHFLPGLALVAALGCGPEPTDRTIVSALRILGVRTEPPEAKPGDDVRVDALIADPKGAGRALTTLWALCTPDPVVGVASCLEPGRTVPIAAQGTSFSITLDSHVLDGLPPAEQDQGIDLFVVFDLRAAATPGHPAEETTAFKRLRVSTSATPNHNPRLLHFRVDGVDGDRSVAAGQTVLLEASVTPASFESYTNPVTGATKKEDAKISWFQTAGTLQDPFTVQDPDGGSRNLWTAEKGAPPATLWIVVRDERGGEDWIRREISAP